MQHRGMFIRRRQRSKMSAKGAHVIHARSLGRLKYSALRDDAIRRGMRKPNAQQKECSSIFSNAFM